MRFSVAAYLFLVLFQFHAQRAQAFQVKIDGARTDVATAGVAQLRRAHTRDERAEDEHGRAQRAAQFPADHVSAESAAIHRYVAALEGAGAAQALDYAQHVEHVGERLATVQNDRAFYHNATGYYGQHGVFRGKHFRFAEQSVPARDYVSIHFFHPSSLSDQTHYPEQDERSARRAG